MSKAKGFHHWTEKDFELLRLYYTGKPAATLKLVELIGGVSVQAVKQKAIKLHLTKTQKMPEWTIAEIAQLEELTPKLSPKRIGLIMHRTENAVKKQQRTNQYSPTNREWFTATDLTNIFNVHYCTVTKWFESGNLKGKRYNRDNGLWQINTKDLREFIIKHPTEIQGRKVDMVFLVDLLTNITNGRS